MGVYRGSFQASQGKVFDDTGEERVNSLFWVAIGCLFRHLSEICGHSGRPRAITCSESPYKQPQRHHGIGDQNWWEKGDLYVLGGYRERVWWPSRDLLLKWWGKGD